MTFKYNFEDLKFYAIGWSFNEDKPKYINVMPYLDTEAFNEAIDKYKSITNYEELYRWISRELKYLFMNKSEFETEIKGLFSDNKVKIDIWNQLIPNVERIVDMVNISFGLNYDKPTMKPKEEFTPISY